MELFYHCLTYNFEMKQLFSSFLSCLMLWKLWVEIMLLLLTVCYMLAMVVWNHSSSWIICLAAAPVLFKKELKSQEALEGEEATMCCETSSPDCKVTWLKGSSVLTHGEKYSIEQRASTQILHIHKLSVKDSGEYTCDTGDKRSTASLTVKGNKA